MLGISSQIDQIDQIRQIDEIDEMDRIGHCLDNVDPNLPMNEMLCRRICTVQIQAKEHAF